MATLASLIVKLGLDAGGFSSDIQSAGQSVSNFGRDIGSVGAGMTARVTAPIVGAGAAAVIMGNQFNAGLANVISLVPSAAGEIEGMRGDIQNLAVDMGKSTGDMTSGLYQVVSAFGYGADSLEILRTNAMAGAAGLASTTEAINLTSAVTKAYGDTSASAVGQVADLAMQTVAMGQTTFPELAASIGRVTPLAASMGVSMNELFGVMATGSGVTGSAAEVSTQFRGILQSLMAPTESMTAAFAELGVTTGAELINIYGLEDGLHNIMRIAEASGQPLQAYIGSIEGQTLAMALAGPQAETWAEKTEAMRNSAGAATLAFEAQTMGVNAAGFSMQQAAIQVQTMAQQVGQALMPAVLTILPYVQQFIDFVAGLVQRFTELDPKTQAIILGVIGFVAALGPLLMIIGPIVTGIGGVITVVGALLSPIGLVVVAVAALAAAFATDFGGIRTTVVGIWEQNLQPIFESIRAWLAEHIPPAIATLADFWTNTLKPAISAVWQFIQTNVFPVFETLLTWLATNIPLALQTLSDFWTNTLQPAISAVWEFIDTNLVPLFEALVNLHIAAISLAVETLALIWTEVLYPALEAVFQFMQDHVVRIFVDLKAKLDGPVGTALRTLANLLSGAVAGALGIFEGALNAAASAIGSIVGKIQTVIGWINTLRERLAGIDLPWFLQPGSPTPFEVGLRGIADALGPATGRVAQFAAAMDDLAVSSFGVANAMQAVGLSFSSMGGVGPSIGGTTGGGPDLFEQLRSFLERMQSLAEKIDAEGLGPARVLAEAAAEIGRNVRAAIEGITAAMTFQLPDVDNTDSLFHALRFFVAKLATTAYIMQWKTFDQAVALAEAAGAIGAQMRKAIEGITAAMTFRVDRVADGTDLLFEALAAFVSKLQATAEGMDYEAFDAATRLAQAAGTIGQNIEAAINGILLAVGFRMGRMADGTDLFVSQLAVFVATLEQAGRTFSEEGLAAATALAQAAGTIGQNIEAAILGMTAAAKYAGLELVQGAKLFAEDAATLVRELAAAAMQFDTAGMGAATAFAQAAGTIGGQIEDAIAGLSALMSYVGGVTLAAVQRLATDLSQMVQGLAAAAGVFDQDALDAAQALASAAGEIGGSVASTVEGLQAIMEYAGGLTQTAIDRFVADLHMMVVELQGAALLFSEGGLAAAERLATVAGVIGEGVQSLAEAMKLITTYTAPAPERIDEFAADMYLVVEKFRIVASVLGEDGINAAERFARAGATIYQAIEDGIDSVLNIAGSGAMGGVGAAMQAMVDQVVTGMGAMATQFAAMVVDAHDFGRDWVDAIMDGMTSRLGDLEDLLAYIRGLFPSSPARYGAWRDLPDGEAVGRGFTASLAGAVSDGTSGVAGALAGLRGAFDGGLVGAGRMAMQPVTINQTINVGDGDPARVREAARLGVVEAARAMGLA